MAGKGGTTHSDYWKALEDVLAKTTFPLYKRGDWRGAKEKLMFGVVPSGNKNGVTPQPGWGLTNRPILLEFIIFILHKVDSGMKLKNFKYAVLQVLKNGKVGSRGWNVFVWASPRNFGDRSSVTG